MAYDKSNYVEDELTHYLKDYTEGIKTQDDINWTGLNAAVRRCREMVIMDELHKQMQPYYEMYLFADPKLLGNRWGGACCFIEYVAARDDAFAFWAQKYDLTSITESWADFLRKRGDDIGVFQKLVRILLEGGYDTDWHQLAETLKNDLHEAEVYSDYKTGELMAFLHGVTMLMDTPWDDSRKMEMFDLLCDNWDFMKHVYSVMIRRPIGCKLNNFAAIANLVEQQPKYHQYIHIFYCVLCDRQPSLRLKPQQAKKLDEHLNRIFNIMAETKPSDALNELCDTLFPEDFQRMLDEFRPETRDEVVRERNRLKYEVGLLTEQMTDMAQKLKDALERSVPIDYIESQLLRLTPGAALDLCGKLTEMLAGNAAWMSNVSVIIEKILRKKEEEDRKLTALLQKMGEPRVSVGQGGVAQITESSIVNQFQHLLLDEGKGA